MANECPKCQTGNPEDSKFCKECATPLLGIQDAIHTITLETPIEELTTGSTFANRYQIIEELGKGGMGKVYKAIDTKINEKIAIKLIKSEIASNKKTIERFSNELKTARKIGHRNVGRMYHLSEEQGTHFITMEYVPGEDLRSMIRMSGQLGIGTAIGIAKQICEGLSEAHRLGVIHRDLKPSNIMIDKQGQARIMDFGIARSLKSKGITGSGIMIGTPEYMSPEQVEAKDVDQRSDIYSLGIILYEMLTGKVPFEGDSPLAVGVKHKSEKPEDPKLFNPRISDDLSQLILNCLEKEKENRPQSTEEICSILKQIEKGVPTAERKIAKTKSPTSKELTVTFNIKKRIIPILIVLAVVAAGVLFWHPWSRKAASPIQTGRPSIAFLYFDNASDEEDLKEWREGLSDSLIIDLSQSLHIDVLSTDNVYSILRRFDLLEARRYSIEDLKRVANEGRVSFVGFGRFSKTEDSIIINFTLKNPHTDEVIYSVEKTCKSEVDIILSIIDELTGEIKAALNLSAEQIAGDYDEEMSQIFSTSPEAIKLYIRGRKFHMQGDPISSIQLMLRAIAIDPGFAMAYRSLGSSYGNIFLFDKKKIYVELAFKYLNRASEREKYNIKHHYYRFTYPDSHFEEAQKGLDKLLEIYPDDEIGNVDQGRFYRVLGEDEKALERLEYVRQNIGSSVVLLTNIISLLREMGQFEETEEIIREFIEENPENTIMYRDLAWNYIDQGKYDLAQKELDKLFEKNPTDFFFLLFTGDIQLLKGELAQAEKTYLSVLESPDPSSNIYLIARLFYLYCLQGRYQKTTELLKKARSLMEETGGDSYYTYKIGEAEVYMYLRTNNLEMALEEAKILREMSIDKEYLDQKREALMSLIFVYLKSKDFESADQTAEELKAIIESHPDKKLIREYYLAKGLVENERMNKAEAIRLLNKALYLFPKGSNSNITWFPIEKILLLDSLGSAYHKSGKMDQAIAEYEKIIAMTTNRIQMGDLYVKAFYHLGKIYEQQNNIAKAIEHYEKFLSLWKDADPGLPEVDDAKNRLAELKDVKFSSITD
ncbi:MAG: protein kinase [Candidatus Aminicenantes bacterium]|nr:protein kinase [Candidatus Aminicenantes bacterium]